MTLALGPSASPASSCAGSIGVLRPGGRVSAIVYSTAERNPFFSIPVTIIRRIAGLPAPAPGTPGPFSLGGPNVLEAAYEDAGFEDVHVDALDAPVQPHTAAPDLPPHRASFANTGPVEGGAPSRPSSGSSDTWIDEDVGVVEGPFVPSGFVVPLTLATEQFRLEPLGPQHNDSDYEAWSSSVEHIHMTPGWETSSWPDDRSLADNLRDLQAHADDFENRAGFTYTVLDPATGDVIGCVYIYPDDSEQHDARVLSWVRASRPELDVQLWRAVTDWLADEWPFERVAYAERADGA